MAQRQFDLIVFDWDGTLMDSTAHIVRSMQAACRSFDLPIPTDEAASHVIGLGWREAIALAAPTLAPADYAKFIEHYRSHHLLHEPQIELFIGAREMLDELRQRGYLLAVATGSSRNRLNRALEAARLANVFDATRCADETFSKPNPAMLHELMRELGQQASRTVMIGDTTHDLQMAANAKMLSIAAAYGAHPISALTAWSPRFCARSIAELANWLRANG